MMKYSKYVLFLLPVFLLFFLGGELPDDGTTKTKVGQDVPEFSGTTLDGKTISIADFKGKVVLINFFTTWCGPCMKEMPVLEEELWKQYRDKGFVVIAVGREHTLEELLEFNRKKGFSFIIMEDPGRKIYGKFATQYIPRNILVDKDGKIIFQSTGYIRKEFNNLREHIRKALEI